MCRMNVDFKRFISNVLHVNQNQNDSYVKNWNNKKNNSENYFDQGCWLSLKGLANTLNISKRSPVTHDAFWQSSIICFQKK